MMENDGKFLNFYCLGCGKQRYTLHKPCQSCDNTGVFFQFEDPKPDVPAGTDRGDDNFLEPVHDYGVQEA